MNLAFVMESPVYLFTTKYCCDELKKIHLYLPVVSYLLMLRAETSTYSMAT